MKTLSILFLNLIICLYSYAQIPNNNVNYKASALTIFLNGNQEVLHMNTNFEIRGNHIKTTNYDQTKNLYLKEKFKPAVLETGHKVIVAQAVDNGGFYCPITIGHLQNDDYFIIIAYNNINFFYEVKLTNDTIPGFPKELPDHSMSTREYTQAEVNDFVRKFGDPASVSSMWLYDFLYGNENGNGKE